MNENKIEVRVDPLRVHFVRMLRVWRDLPYKCVCMCEHELICACMHVMYGLYVCIHACKYELQVPSFRHSGNACTHTCMRTYMHAHMHACVLRLLNI